MEINRIDQKTQRFLAKIAEESIVFFAGPCLSIEQGMPHPKELLDKMADYFLPKDKKYKALVSKIKTRIQPENFYESLLYLGASPKSFSLWKLYSSQFLQENNIIIQPNMSHFFLVDYAYKSGIPIFTTNVDTLFERTCAIRSYPYRVVHISNQLQQMSLNELNKKNKVTLFKLNGSAEISSSFSNINLEQLNMTLSKLYRTNAHVTNTLASILDKKQAAFVGYNGSDADYFPQLKDLFQKVAKSTQAKLNTYFWVNPTMETQSNLRQDFSSKGGNIIVNTFYTNAQLIPQHPNQLFKPLTNYSDSGEHATVVKKMALFKEKLLEDLKQTVALNHSNSLLLLILLCQRISAYQEGHKLSVHFSQSTQEENPMHQVIFHYIKASFLHNTGQFVSYRKTIQEVLEITKNHPEVHLFKLRAKMSLAEASRMLWVNPGTLNEGNSVGRAITVIVHFIWVKLRIRKNKVQLLTKKSLSVLETSVLHAMIEHDIRLYAMFQHVYIRKFKNRIKFITSFFENLWDSIIKISQEVGYLGGIGNAQKFLVGLKGDTSLKPKEEGQHLFNFMSDQIGQELISMNQAIYQQLIKNYEKAKQIYLDVYINASKSGNNLNIIKALVGISQCNRCLKIKPILEPQLYKKLEITCSIIEGHLWQKKLQKILRQIKLQN